MPIIASAKKALRSGARKRVYNLRRKNSIDKAVKNLKKLIEDKNKDEAKKALSSVYQALDKATKTGLIKVNTASRKKSRFSLMVKMLSQA